MMPTPRSRPLPPDGLDRALRDGRHRRRKAAAAIGAPALSLAVALVLVIQGGAGGADSLKTLNDPDPTATSTSTPDPQPTPDTLEHGDPPAPDASGDPTPDPSESAVCSDYCDPEPEPEPSDVSTPRPVYAHRATGTDSHQTVPSSNPNCTPRTTNGEGDGVCGYTTTMATDTTIRPGESIAVTFTVCRRVTTSTADITFEWSGGQEKDGFVVAESDRFHYDRSIWRESDFTTWVGEPHSDLLRPQTCFAWDFSWDGRMSDGSPAAPGNYLIDARPHVQKGPQFYLYVNSGVLVTVTE